MRVCLSLCLALPLFAGNIADEIHTVVQAYHDQGTFNGSVLVADKGSVVLSRGYGMANIEWEIPNTPDTKFRIGSLTKQFTAALALTLVQEGKLELEAPVSRYLPDFPRRMSDKVTIAQLMNHTSGIPGYTELPGLAESLQTPTRPGDFIKKLHDVEFLFPPGTAFSYNNSAYFLLGYIIEKITGKSYERVLEDKIFGPLGMSSSGFDSPAVILLKRADGYENTFDGYRNATPIEMTRAYAAGALYSTVEDLHRWDEALYGDTVLARATKEKMFRPGLEDYGFGFYIRTNNGRTSIEHNGVINGFRSLMRRYPETKRLVVLLNNTDVALLAPLADAIIDVLDGKTPKLPKPPAGPVLRKTYDSAGISEVLKQLRAWADSADPPVATGLDQLVRLHRYIISRSRAEDALALARYMSATNPKSETAAITHARAAKAAGSRVEALKAYGRALELSRTPRNFPSLIAEMQQLAASPE